MTASGTRVMPSSVQNVMMSRGEELVHRGVSSTSPPSAGDPLPANGELIAVHVSELKQLFNAIDPSPFRERDLDPHAEEFITDWANEAPPGVTLGLAVYLDRPAGLANEPAELHFRDVGSASSFAVAGRALPSASAPSACRSPAE